LSTELFPKVAKGKPGYKIADVDQFFETARAAYEGRGDSEFQPADIQTASFGLERGGYDTQEVDSALDRLEAAFIARARSQYVAYYGEPAWHAMLADRARTLYPRLSRKAGQRFAPPAKGTQGYKASEVDALCDRLTAFFDNDEPITAAQIRTAAFSHAKGKSAYAEAPVDAFFARAIEVLLGVE